VLRRRARSLAVGTPSPPASPVAGRAARGRAQPAVRYPAAVVAVGGILAGRYRLDAVVGAGGMATVFRAWDGQLERAVAVKVLASNLAADPEVATRFRAEARHLASLSHPGIVAVYDVGEADDGPYFVMELIDGESLEARLARDGRAHPDDVVPIVTSIADGLGALHDRGLIHRDVKPLNILLPRTGRARLADFGLVRGDATTHLTAPGIAVGTLAYMAPELLRGDAASPASDVYALGAVTYRALTGALPYPAATLAELVAAHASPPTPVSARAPTVGTAFDGVLAAALGPAERRPTARDFASAVRDAARSASHRGAVAAVPSPTATAAQTVVVRRPAPDIPPSRPGRGVVVAGLGALALLAAVLFAAMLGGPGPERTPRATGDGPAVGSPAESPRRSRRPRPATPSPVRPTETPPATPSVVVTPPPTAGPPEPTVTAPPPTEAPPETAAFDEALARYRAAVDDALAAGDLDEDDAAELRERAAEVDAHVDAGDRAAARAAADELVEETADVADDLPAERRDQLVGRARAVRDEVERLGG
jgi:eukaryotic-like serine/threonine-protein kinase